jgi:hypothetical protein
MTVRVPRLRLNLRTVARRSSLLLDRVLASLVVVANSTSPTCMAVSPIGSDATSPAANRLKAAQFLSEIDPDPSKRSSTSDRPLLEHGLTELEEEEEEPWR